MAAHVTRRRGGLLRHTTEEEKSKGRAFLLFSTVVVWEKAKCAITAYVRSPSSIYSVRGLHRRSGGELDYCESIFGGSICPPLGRIYPTRRRASGMAVYVKRYQSGSLRKTDDFYDAFRCKRGRILLPRNRLCACPVC